MLVRTIAEVRKYLPVNISDDFTNISPFIKQSERDFVIPLIGKELYDAMENDYDDMSEAEIAVQPFIQEAITLYAYYLAIPHIQVEVGDAGIRVSKTDTKTAAFQYMVNDLQSSILRQAMSAADAMLEFLDENQDNYDEWVSSSAFTEFKSYFIPNSKKFTELYSAMGNSRLNFLRVKSQMKKVEEMVIQSELSTAYYLQLKTTLADGSITNADKIIVDFVQKVVANLTIAKAIDELAVQIDEQGVFKFDSTGSRLTINPKTPSSDDTLDELEASAQEDGLAYLKMLKDYLFANIGNYPTYAGSTAYNAVTTDTSFANDADKNKYFGAL